MRLNQLLSEEEIFNLSKDDFDVHEHEFKLTVYSFMFKELGLSGTELLIYAAIYSAKNKTLVLSYSDLSELLNLSMSGIKTAIKNLVAGNLINKSQIPNELKHRNIYSIKRIS